jgi:hypothetical protein
MEGGSDAHCVALRCTLSALGISTANHSSSSQPRSPIIHKCGGETPMKSPWANFSHTALGLQRYSTIIWAEGKKETLGQTRGYEAK